MIRRTEINKIYAMPISKDSEEFCDWTRVKCKRILGENKIICDLIDTGETFKEVFIKDLINIPDYIVSQKKYVKRFQLIGCRSISPKDFNSEY